MIEQTVFYNTAPVPDGTCKRCAGYGTVKSQHSMGEVRYPTCSRCKGTGKEPARGRFGRFLDRVFGDTMERHP